MPRLLAVGHVTWDRIGHQEVLGGTVAYAALAVRALGWDAAVLTAAGPDLDPVRELPGIEVFVRPARTTTRFINRYDEDGERSQVLLSSSDPIDLLPLPDRWRQPDALLLGPVAGEISPGMANAFEAGLVGAVAQGWLRQFDAHGTVTSCEWDNPQPDLSGVHILVLSERDLPRAAETARRLLCHVPIVALTRGWRGARLFSRSGESDVPSLPRREVDATGAGDVFAATLLVRYHETGDVLAAAAFAACAASCVVEGVGASTVGDRADIERRLLERERLIEEGEWDE